MTYSEEEIKNDIANADTAPCGEDTTGYALTAIAKLLFNINEKTAKLN